MPGIYIDTSYSPLLRVRFDGVVDDDAFRRYLEEHKAFVDRGTRYAVVLDATTAGVPSAAQRRLQTDFIQLHLRRLQTQCVGGAFVIPSQLVRGGLTAMLWVQPLPFPHKLLGDVAAAEAWCRERLGTDSPVS